MDKTESKYRDIQFYSEKNQKLMSVHTRDAKTYADILEKSPNVVKYKCIVPLDPAFLDEISKVGIRAEHFQTAWASDFWIENADGSTSIREIIPLEHLIKKADIQKLEISRRYWKRLDVDDWKIVIMTRGGDGYVL